MTNEQKIRAVIDRVLWTAGATDDNRRLLAEAISESLAAPSIASSAPADERAAFEADTLELFPVATFGRFASGPYNINWVQDQWNGWQRRAAMAAQQAAPAARLVQALTECADIMLSNGISDCEAYDQARDALASLPAKAAPVTDLAEIARLIGTIFFAGDFVAETHNERELEALLIKTGYRYRSWSEVEAAAGILSLPVPPKEAV